MGNNDSGDGYRYHGRGYIQLTGRDNYRAAGDALNLDLERNPDLAAQPDNAARVAVWFWQHNVPQADRVDVLAATRRVNGGTNGLDQRRESYDRWYATLTPQFFSDLDAGRIGPGFHAGQVTGQTAACINPLHEIEQFAHRMQRFDFDYPVTEDLPDYLRARRREPALDSVLRQGESGSSVRSLQEDLNRVGITDGQGRMLVADGIFGRSTRECVENFQLWNGLPTTGIADERTLAALRHPSLASTPAHPEDGANLRRNYKLEGYEQPSRPGPTLPSDASHDAGDIGPRSPGHRDHAMYLQVRAHVHRLDAECGRSLDEVSDRLTASLLCLAKENGLSRVDHVVLSERHDNGRVIRGENVFVVQGALNDPAHYRGCISMSEATACPEKDSYRNLQLLNQQLDQQQELRLQQHDVQQAQFNPHVMRM